MKLVDSKIRVQVSITMSLSLPAMHGQLVHERVKVPCCSRAVEIFRCMAAAVVSCSFEGPKRQLLHTILSYHCVIATPG